LATETLAPCRAKVSAMPKLMPVVPPNTKTCLPAKSSDSAIVRTPRDQACLVSFLRIFEGELDLGPVDFDLAVVDAHVELADLSNAQVAQRFPGPLDCGSLSLLPGFGAGSDQLDDLVNGLGHDCSSMIAVVVIGRLFLAPRPSANWLRYSLARSSAYRLRGQNPSG